MSITRSKQNNEGEHSKRPSATKRGPGRYSKHGNAGNRVAKARRTRAADALVAAWAAKRITKAKLRDSKGRAYTLVGSVYSVEGVHPDHDREHVMSAGSDNGEPFYTARRIWLAGISAQRGY